MSFRNVTKLFQMFWCKNKL